MTKEELIDQIIILLKDKGSTVVINNRIFKFCGRKSPIFNINNQDLDKSKKNFNNCVFIDYYKNTLKIKIYCNNEMCKIYNLLFEKLKINNLYIEFCNNDKRIINLQI